MSTKRSILIATGNSGKLREIRQIIHHPNVAWLTLAEFPNLPEAVEHADTFLQNAIDKAMHYSRLTGQWTLADDSGLEVDVLAREPGVRSARYAGTPCDDDANNAKLIDALKDISPKRRAARFRCAVALLDGKNVLATAEGYVEGIIIDQPRGRYGFGYDPHFLVPEFGMTTAEMSPERKNRVSHRGQALRAIHPELANLVERL